MEAAEDRQNHPEVESERDQSGKIYGLAGALHLYLDRW